MTKNNQTVIANSARGVTSYRKQFLEVRLHASASKVKAEYDLLTDIFSVLVYKISIPTPSESYPLEIYSNAINICNNCCYFFNFVLDEFSLCGLRYNCLVVKEDCMVTAYMDP